MVQTTKTKTKGFTPFTNYVDLTKSTLPKNVKNPFGGI